MTDVIGDEEEAEIIAALLGAFSAYFLQPWSLAGLNSVLVGGMLTGGMTMMIGRLGDENFTPGTSAVLGVVVMVTVMQSVGI